MYDLGMDKDSDVNTAGTEEHSSFSEQAWDSYQVTKLVYLMVFYCFLRQGGKFERHLEGNPGTGNTDR